MKNESVLIGMSGGVDSSVTAFLLKEAGYNCIGCTMLLHGSPCGGEDHTADAQAVAVRLGIPFSVFDFQNQFSDQVIGNFIGCYERGRIPNPCIECNKYLKFGAMLDKALALGCQYVATGHYAQIHQDSNTGRYLLYKAADRAKDQTYFLYGLNQHQLSHTLFPLGSLTKEQARQIAEAQGFLNARKRDSQDICFVPDGDYAAFMERYLGKTYPGGDYLDLDGNVVGKHQGAVRYTLGQRKGLGIALGAPVYVCSKDMEKNTVTVGPNEALFAKGLLAENWNWFPFPELTAPMEVTAKIRHSQTEQPATVYPEANGFARVVFHQPQRAITPGQAVVLYQGDMVVGGGTITKALTI
ncbi:MAG: tRNA 2-thiouridine(34) synthase MnmA [Oscillospiraceae bacterium]|nr:tRNA 2-thiouridine(34) synthase MnmA [Oscillospiraceae bacterium]